MWTNREMVVRSNFSLTKTKSFSLDQFIERFNVVMVPLSFFLSFQNINDTLSVDQEPMKA